jgi:mitochondrial fission protein ELM1
MPWGPIDPRERPCRTGSPIAPPFPDILIASGRRAVPYVRAVKRASAGTTLTVILKDPRTGPGAADLIWAPSYDRIRGPNVLTTLTSPHRVSADLLDAARNQPDPRLVSLPGPRVAVLIGGPSRHARFDDEDGARLLAGLGGLLAAGASLMITPSRRTPQQLRTSLRKLTASPAAFVWEGKGENPLVSMLALADAILVTADSMNMISEAVATGAPVLLFELAGQGRRHGAFLDELRRRGAIRPFRGQLEQFGYERLDSTSLIAEAVARAYLSHRAKIAAAPAVEPGRSS